jgi:hypothetical protein
MKASPASIHTIKDNEKYNKIKLTTNDRKESTGGNSVLPKLAVKCKIEAVCYYQPFVQIDSDLLGNRQL